MLFALLVACVLLFVVLNAVGAALWSLFWAMVVGLLLGLLARMVAPGQGGRMGLLLTSLIGVAGGLIGTAIARALDTGGFGRFLLQLFVATILVIALRPAVDHS